MVVALGMLFGFNNILAAFGECMFDQADEERGEPDMEEDSDED